MFKKLVDKLVAAILRSNQGQQEIRRTIETVQAEQDKRQREAIIAHFDERIAAQRC